VFERGGDVCVQCGDDIRLFGRQRQLDADLPALHRDIANHAEGYDVAGKTRISHTGQLRANVVGGCHWEGE
jgi:hypothetical protein